MTYKINISVTKESSRVAGTQTSSTLSTEMRVVAEDSVASEEVGRAVRIWLEKSKNRF